MRALFRTLRPAALRLFRPGSGPAPQAVPAPIPANRSAAPPAPLLRPAAEEHAFAVLLETARCRAHWRPATRSALQLALTLDSFRREALQEGLGWYFLVHPDRNRWLRTARALNQIGAEEITAVFDGACRTCQRLDHFGGGAGKLPPFAAEEERLWEMKAALRLQRRANRYFWHHVPWANVPGPVGQP